MLKVSGNRNTSYFTNFTKFFSAFKVCLASCLTQAKQLCSTKKLMFEFDLKPCDL